MLNLFQHPTCSVKKRRVNQAPGHRYTGYLSHGYLSDDMLICQLADSTTSFFKFYLPTFLGSGFAFSSYSFGGVPPSKFFTK